VTHCQPCPVCMDCSSSDSGPGAGSAPRLRPGWSLYFHTNETLHDMFLAPDVVHGSLNFVNHLNVFKCPLAEACVVTARVRPSGYDVYFGDPSPARVHWDANHSRNVSMQGRGNESLCSAGYEGPLCAMCANDFSRDGWSGPCTTCVGTGAKSMGGALLPFLIMVLCFWLWNRAMKKSRKARVICNSMSRFSDDEVAEMFVKFDADGNGTVDQKELYGGLTAMGLDVSYKEARDIFHEVDADGGGSIDSQEFLDWARKVKGAAFELFSILKIVMGLLQLLALLGDTVEMEMPPYFFNFRPTNFDPSGIPIPDSCGIRSFQVRFLVSGAGIPLLILLGCFVVQRTPRVVRWLQGETRINAADADGVVEVAKDIKLVGLEKMLAEAVVRDEACILFALLTLVYAGMSHVAFSAFVCRRFSSNEQRLVADFGQVCGDSAHQLIQYVATLFVALQVSYPLLLALKMFMKTRNAPKGSSADIELQEHYAFATTEFRPARYYWECVDMLRKVVFCGGIMLFHRGSLAQALALCVLQICFSLTLAQQWPYASGSSNNLRVAAESSYSIMLVLVVLQRAQGAGSELDKRAMDDLWYYCSSVVPGVLFVGGVVGAKCFPDTAPASPGGDGDAYEKDEEKGDDDDDEEATPLHTLREDEGEEDAEAEEEPKSVFLSANKNVASSDQTMSAAMSKSMPGAVLSKGESSVDAGSFKGGPLQVHMDPCY